MIEKKRKEANKIPGVTLEKDRNIDKNLTPLFVNLLMTHKKHEKDKKYLKGL